MNNKKKTPKSVYLKTRNKLHQKTVFQMYSPREKLHGHIWDFTIGDTDDHPSVPHAHWRDKGYRLDAWTGDIYPAGTERKEVIGKLRKKDLRRLHSDMKYIDFAKKQIDWYRLQYPQTTFYVPKWFELKYIQCRILSNQHEEVFTYTFFGRSTISNQRSVV